MDGSQKVAPRPRRTNSILPAWITNPTRIANTLYQRTGTKSSNARKSTPPIHPSQSVRSISSASSNASMEKNELIYCAANGDLDLVKQRLVEGEDVNVKNDAGETPLSQAVAYGFADVVQLLLKEGADVGMRNLVQAAKRGHVEVVRVLLEHGMDVSQPDSNDNKDTLALHKAAQNGHDDVVRLLLAHGADVDVKDFRRDTPLHKAAAKNRLKTVQILLNNGAKNDSKATSKAGVKNKETFDLLLNSKYG